MTNFRWLRKLVSFLALLNIRIRYQRRSSLIKIEAAKVYVSGVKTIRYILLGALLVLLCLILFACGLSLIHTALLTYSGWSVEAKFMAALVLGGLEVIVAGGILFFMFSEKTWVKYSGINRMVNSVTSSAESDRDQ